MYCTLMALLPSDLNPNIDHNLRTTPAIRKLTSPSSPQSHQIRHPRRTGQNDPQMRPVPANPAAGSGELRDTAPEMGGAV